MTFTRHSRLSRMTRPSVIPGNTRRLTSPSYRKLHQYILRQTTLIWQCPLRIRVPVKMISFTSNNGPTATTCDWTIQSRRRSSSALGTKLTIALPLMQMHQVFHQRCPTYLSDLFNSVGTQRRLCSTTTRAAFVRWTRNQFGRRAFAVCGPDIWNALPQLSAPQTLTLLSGVR